MIVSPPRVQFVTKLRSLSCMGVNAFVCAFDVMDSLAIYVGSFPSHNDAKPLV